MATLLDLVTFKDPAKLTFDYTQCVPDLILDYTQCVSDLTLDYTRCVPDLLGFFKSRLAYRPVTLLDSMATIKEDTPKNS